MGSNPAEVKRAFIKIFISILRNLIILLCSMVATWEKNSDLNAEDCALITTSPCPLEYPVLLAE